MKTVLFVCVENSCRSQMAEAFARLHGQGFLEVYSSGSRPSGKVNERAIQFMAERGYDLTRHRSKSLDEIPPIHFDYAITLGCGDECPYVAARQRADWKLPDPKHLSDEDFRAVRNEIEARVKDLIKNL